jgi:hypothetical protein
MGFAASDVAAGIAQLLAARGMEAGTERDGEAWLFRAADVEIAVGPLPDERRSTALFQPRCLLVLRGEGPRAAELRAAIRLKFLRVTG